LWRDYDPPICDEEDGGLRRFGKGFPRAVCCVVVVFAVLSGGEVEFFWQFESLGVL
jgi:hypothetical protein